MDVTDSDIRQIRAIIERQFAALSWSVGNSGDWPAFAADFCEDAKLFPARRPLAPVSVEAFLARMKSLAGGELRSLQEVVLKTDIRVFGNIAYAAVLCGMTENDTAVSQTVEMLLLVKDDSGWRIAAQAWDRVDASKSIDSLFMTNGVC